MPLEFPNWSWSQSEASVHLQLPVRGATAAKVDVVSTEQYLKVRRTQASSAAAGSQLRAPSRVDGCSVHRSTAPPTCWKPSSPSPWMRRPAGPGSPTPESSSAWPRRVPAPGRICSLPQVKASPAPGC